MANVQFDGETVGVEHDGVITLAPDVPAYKQVQASRSYFGGVDSLPDRPDMAVTSKADMTGDTSQTFP